MMSRKHFEVIAANIRQCSPSCEEVAAMTGNEQAIYSLMRKQFEAHAIGLCHFFKTENPQFDSNRFMQACGF